MTTHLLVEEEMRARDYTCQSTDLLVIGELTGSTLRTSYSLMLDGEF